MLKSALYIFTPISLVMLQMFTSTSVKPKKAETSTFLIRNDENFRSVPLSKIFADSFFDSTSVNWLIIAGFHSSI